MPDYTKKELEPVRKQILKWGETKFGFSIADRANVEIDMDAGAVCLAFVTSNNVYYIRANPNYLGCVSSERYPAEGKKFTRGSDLHDGSFSEDTWLRIMKDIAMSEMESIQKRSDILKLQAQGA